MSARPAKRARYGEKGKSAYLKAAKAMAVHVVPRPMVGASSRVYAGPLPATCKTRLTYQTTLSLNAGAGAWLSNIFAANGIFDPDITGVGHQPRGRDEMTALYNHNYVTAAYITCRYVGEANGNVIVWGVAVRDDATPFATVNDFAEYRNSKYKCAKTTITTNEMVITQKVIPHKFLGIKTWDDDALRGTSAANPSEMVYFHVGCADAFGGDPGAASIDVHITYYVTFTEPKPLTQS